MSFNIVMVEPEIPQNTGNVARTCAVTGASLHLVKPFGFEIDDKKLKRAGLDYWDSLDITIYENLDEFFAKNKGTFYFASTKSLNRYSDVKFKDGDYILFGKETKGLDEKLLKHAKIDKNIVFVGSGRQIRIWAEEVWNEREQNRNYDKMREIMSKYSL